MNHNFKIQSINLSDFERLDESTANCPVLFKLNNTSIRTKKVTTTTTTTTRKRYPFKEMFIVNHDSSNSTTTENVTAVLSTTSI